MSVNAIYVLFSVIGAIQIRDDDDDNDDDDLTRYPRQQSGQPAVGRRSEW